MVRKHKEQFVTDPGSPIQIQYSPVVDEHGNITLEESGKINTDEMIQSFAESCDLKVIANRFVNGDLNAFNQTRGIYGDFTKMPETYAEVLQMQIDSKIAFEKLPPDVRAKFDNDVNKFLAAAGEKDWYEKLGIDTALDDNVPKESSEAAATAETAKGE